MSISIKWLRSEVFIVGVFDYKLDVIVIDLEKFDIIFG